MKAHYEVGESMNFEVYRNGEYVDVSIVLFDKHDIY